MSSKTVSIDLFFNLWHQSRSWQHISIDIYSFDGLLEGIFLSILITIEESTCNFSNILFSTDDIARKLDEIERLIPKDSSPLLKSRENFRPQI